MNHAKRSRIFRVSLLTMFLSIIFNSTIYAQNFSNGFNFYLPPADTGSTRFIPQFPRVPLTDQDFVSIDQDGHFSVRGKPTRFFGTGLMMQGTFPPKTKQWFIAGRLRKMGFNLIRLVNLDNAADLPGQEPQSLFLPGTTTRQLNPVTLDILESLISNLKNNGIYIDLSLFTYRHFNSLDGVPDADSLRYPFFGDGTHFFDPQILSLNKEYAQQLLTHINPYTGKALANDPVLATIEISNEKELYTNWIDGQLKHFSSGGILTWRHTKMLDSLWVTYLKSKYTSTSALRNAWNTGAISPTQLLVNGSFEDDPPLNGWTLRVTPPANASISRDSLSQHSGKYSAKVTVSQVGGANYQVSWTQNRFSLMKDWSYTISFAAKSDSSRPFIAALQKEPSPWTVYGSAGLSLTPEWKTYSFTIQPHESASEALLTFLVGEQAGTYWFDDVSVTTGVSGLLSDESFETSFIRRIDYKDCWKYTEPRVRDKSSFYIKLQDDYYAQMYSYLKDTLHIKIPITGTNVNYGPPDMAVQSKLEYIDNHCYWDPPKYPSVQWSLSDWYIENTPMVQSNMGGTMSQLMCEVPGKGKPYTISEYGHYFPGRYISEAPLFITAYFSFHDVDGFNISFYRGFNDLSGYGDHWENDKIWGNLCIHRNSAMMALMPSCALAYRTGMISKARQTLLVNYAPDDYLLLPRKNFGIWWESIFVDKKLALKYGVRTKSFTSSVPFDASSLPPVPTNPYVTDTKEIMWNTDGLLSVASNKFVGATGFLNNFVNTSAGPMMIKAADGWGTLTWISLTQDSLQRASLSLLTVSTRAQNTGMVWDGITTVHDNWGTAPTQVEPLKVTLQLSIMADSIRIFPLDTIGRDTRGYTTYKLSASNGFTVDIDQSQSKSMWFGIQRFKGTVKPSFIAKLRDTTIAQNQTLRFNYTASDPNNEALTYALINPPTGATITSSGVFNWTPAYTQKGTFQLMAVVMNSLSLFTDTTRAAITVLTVNMKPSFVTKLQDTTIAQKQTLSFTYKATDPNGDSLRFSLLAPPAGAAISPTGVFSWTPSYSQQGIYTIVAVASKTMAALADTARSAVTVTKVHLKPVINYKIPATITQVSRNQPMTFAVSATEPTGDPLTFTWKVNDAVMKSGPDSSYTVTFSDPNNSPKTVSVVCTEPGGLKDSTMWSFTITFVARETDFIPTEFALAQNYPNPFNPATVIRFDIPKQAAVTLEVYSILGNKVRTLIGDHKMNPGRYTVVWDGKDESETIVSTGVYICRIIAGDFRASGKMMLLR